MIACVPSGFVIITRGCTFPPPPLSLSPLPRPSSGVEVFPGVLFTGLGFRVFESNIFIIIVIAIVTLCSIGY